MPAWIQTRNHKSITASPSSITLKTDGAFDMLFLYHYVIAHGAGIPAGVTIHTIRGFVSFLSDVETIKSSGAENSFFARWSGYEASVNSQRVKFAGLDARLGKVPAKGKSVAFVGGSGCGKSAHSAAVDTLLVAGKVLMEKGELKTLDEERIMFEAQRCADRLVNLHGAEKSQKNH